MFLPGHERGPDATARALGEDSEERPPRLGAAASSGPGWSGGGCGVAPRLTPPSGRGRMPSVPGALDGVRILDLTWGAAGALGVLLLAEQGADTLKVEPPGGDPFRSYDGYKVWTRSRRAVQIDHKSDAGRAAFHRLVETADVVVESFRPGVADRLGVGYDACAATNPRVVYCSVPAWPEGHRFADRPGYDALVQAAAGQQWEQPGWRTGPIFLAMPLPSMGTVY